MLDNHERQSRTPVAPRHSLVVESSILLHVEAISDVILIITFCFLSISCQMRNRLCLHLLLLMPPACSHPCFLDPSLLLSAWHDWPMSPTYPSPLLLQGLSSTSNYLPSSFIPFWCKNLYVYSLSLETMFHAIYMVLCKPCLWNAY